MKPNGAFTLILVMVGALAALITISLLREKNTISNFTNPATLEVYAADYYPQPPSPAYRPTPAYRPQASYRGAPAYRPYPRVPAGRPYRSQPAFRVPRGAETYPAYPAKPAGSADFANPNISATNSVITF